MTRWLRDDELQLWRTCMHVALTVQGCIADDFKIHGITVADYSVLVPLSESPTGKCSVGQIARKGAWDAPGLARHIRRMEERGLVQRTATSEGTSGTSIELTPRAQELMSAAAPQHVERVRSILFDNLDSDDLKSLRKIMTQLSGGLPERLLGYAAEPIAAESLRGSLILSPPESERAQLEAAADSQTLNVASEESAQSDDTGNSSDDAETTSTDDPVGQESRDTTESPVNVSQSGDIKLSSDQDLNKSHSALTGSADIAGSTAGQKTSGETEPLGKTPAGELAEAETSAEDLADDVTRDDSLTEDADEDSAAGRSAEEQADLDSDASLDSELDDRDDAADEDDPADEIGTDSSEHSLASKVRDEVEDDTPVTASSDSVDNDKDDPVGESDNPKQPTADSDVDAPESVNSSTKSLFGLSARMVDNLDRLDRFGMGEPITYESSPLPKIDGITDSHRRIGQSSDERSDDRSDDSSSQQAPEASAQAPAQTAGSFEAEYEAAYENNPHPPREGQDKYQHYTYGPSPLPTISTSDHSQDSDEGSASANGSASSQGSASPEDTVTPQASAPAETAEVSSTSAEAEAGSKPSSGRKLGALRIDETDSEAASDSPDIDATQSSPSDEKTESDTAEAGDADARHLTDSELTPAEDAAATETPANAKVTNAEVADASLADSDVADTGDETDADAEVDVESSTEAADVVTSPTESHEDSEEAAAEVDDDVVSRDLDEAPEDSHPGSDESASDDDSASDASRSSADIDARSDKSQSDDYQADDAQPDVTQSDDAQSSEVDSDEPHVAAGAVAAEDVSDADAQPAESSSRNDGPAIVPDKRRIQGVRKLLPSPRGKSEPKAASTKAKPAGPKRFVSARRKVGGAASAETPSRTSSKEADSKVGVTSAAIPQQRVRHNHNRELCRATAPWQYPARPATNGDNQHMSSGTSNMTLSNGLSESLATELWSPISPPLPPRQHSNCPLPQPSA